MKIINNSWKVFGEASGRIGLSAKTFFFSELHLNIRNIISHFAKNEMQREEVENIKNSLNSCLHNMEDTLVWSFSDIITYLSSRSHKIPIKTRSIQFPNQNPIDFTPPRATHIR